MQLNIETIVAHPAHGRYVPSLDPKAFAELKDSIDQCGLLQPLDVWANDQTVLLDGTHRLKALAELGVAVVEARLVETDDPEGYVYTVALKRRHLTDGQRAAMASLWAEAHKKQGERTDLTSARHHAEVPADPSPTRAEATASHSVTRRQHEQATYVRERAPEVLEQVRDGEVDLKAAYRSIKQDEKKADRKARSEAVLSAAPEPIAQRYLPGEVYCSAVSDVDLTPGSIGMIFTDPPYHDEHIARYRELGELAAKALRPGGYCMTYAGKMFLPQVMQALGEAGLEYVWTFAVFHPFSTAKISKHHLFENWRPVLLYRNGAAPAGEWVQDVVRGRRNKDEHEWQQDEDCPRQYIPIFAEPEDVVLDPFVGGGTTIRVCKYIGQPFLGFDIDVQSVQITRQSIGL